MITPATPRKLMALLTLFLGTTLISAGQDQSAVKAPTVPTLIDFAQIGNTAQQQIRELIAEKQARTPVQRKVGSSLLYEMKARQGVAITKNVKALQPLLSERTDGRADVEVLGTVTKPLIEAVQRAGGDVIKGRIGGSLLRAIVPLAAVEDLAGMAEVRRIRQSVPAITQRMQEERARRLRLPLRSAVQQLQSKSDAAQATNLTAGAGGVVSEGVTAHKVDQALHFFGVTGAGTKIGVLSDSDDFKEQAITTGDLPVDTVTVPGEDGRPGAGEGTAMMEIVHDVAPGAKLYFATAFTSAESFADNIRTLRFVYGCDIIVDDVIYFFESPFQDDIIAKAVQDVINSGGMYFSSAGNQGNLNDGTSGVWEGDFRKATTTIPALAGLGDIQDFGQGVVSDRVELGGGPLVLHWADVGTLDNPQAADDYDLYVLDSTLSNVAAASTDVQDGSGLPFEFLGFFIPPNFRVVVVKASGTDRAIRIQLFGGELALATSGGSYGHNSVADAFGVAAVDAALAGGGAFAGGATNPVELFSADGNRRVFFDRDGNSLTPGNFLFRTNGGQVRKKPDVAAADGVSTTLPPFSGLNPFFGTSAAAPHAAAIAGLVQSAKPGMTPAKVRSALTKTALDIEATGRDRDSGFGILDAFAALSFVNAKPSPFLELGTATATSTTGDGDAFIEPGESASLLVPLSNIGGAATANLRGLLSTTTPNVTLTKSVSDWPSISPLGGSGTNKDLFTFALSPAAQCGIAPEFTLTAGFSNGPISPQTFIFKVPTGKPSPTPVAASYAGPVVAVPDDDPAGITVPITVSGLSAISKIAFRFDGATCTADAGATTVGLDHSWVGDLIVTLTSPQGTTVTLMDQPGGSGNSGNNFCQTVLDDSASASIQSITPADAPYTGTFQPAGPLAAFKGESANGTWMLKASDNAFIDTGSVRAFSLVINGFTCD